MKPWRNYIFVEEIKEEESPFTSTEEEYTKRGKVVDIGPDVKGLEVGQTIQYTTYKIYKLKDVDVIDDDSIIAYE